MTDFRPFKAWRYNCDSVKAEEVIAPPYDVISKEEQDQLYEKSPYNCIRLILNRVEESDTPNNNRYTRAHNFFTEWRQNGPLVQEGKPSFYLYRQTFKDLVVGTEKERFSLLGRLKLEPFDKGVVIPHEKTLAKPKKDRLALLQTAQANFSPIFGLYEDPEKEVVGAFAEAQKSAPVLEAKDKDGVTHQVWVISDDSVVEKIQKGLQEKPVYIADGHHRYQTSLDYSTQMREGREGEIGSDFTLAALVEFSDTGLDLLPTHRMVLPYDGFDPQKAVEALKEDFEVEPMAIEELEKKLEGSPQFEDWIATERQMGLLLANGDSYLLTLKSLKSSREKMPKDKAEVWYHLDVTLISNLILAKLWSVPESEWESILKYTHCNQEARSSVQSGKAAATFMLKASPVEILRELGKTGELMPQKSTYFYPKLASGLAFYSHND